MGPDARRSLATVLVVFASLLLAAATLTGYARRAFFDPDQFANRASATLHDSSVRTLIGERVTDRVVLRQNADLLAARPLIASAVAGVVGGRAFSSLFHRAALDAHRAIFERDENTVALTVADIGTVAAAAASLVRRWRSRESCWAPGGSRRRNPRPNGSRRCEPSRWSSSGCWSSPSR
jgi:hypothetical protein